MSKKMIYLMILMSFYLQIVPLCAQTLFLAHYNGDTNNFGCEADFSRGITYATIESNNFEDWPSMTTAQKFGGGLGALDLDWWFGRALKYEAVNNYSQVRGTVDFFLRADDVFSYDLVEEDYVFHGGSSNGKRYVFFDDLDAAESGHIEIWIEQSSYTDKAIVLNAQICGSSGGNPVIISLSSDEIYGQDGFRHYALQWDCVGGTASIFQDGILINKRASSSWDMSNLADWFALGMGTSTFNIFTTGAINIDELRISDVELYDSSVQEGLKSFDVPLREYKSPDSPKTTFLAHYNGNTSNDGLDADFSCGSGTVTIPDSSFGVPTINTGNMKFGLGAVDMPWWSERSMLYQAGDNYDNSYSTIDFQLNLSNIYQEINGEYVFDGVKRYVFNDDIAWAESGHVDIWVDGTAGEATVRVVANIFKADNDCITLMGSLLTYNGGGNQFQHYALQWDSIAGEAALFEEGLLFSKYSGSSWQVDNTPTIFEVGMNCIANASKVLIDELRIVNETCYDSSVSVGLRSFYAPVREYATPGQSVTTFLAHYNGDTDNDGLDADYSLGLCTVTIPNSSYGVPTINTNSMKFGSGAVDMPWWSDRSMVYQAEDNYDNSYSTIDFQMNLSNIYEQVNGEYVFDGVRRYVFNDDIPWAESGYVDIWVDGTAGDASARVVVHVFRADNDCITLMGPLVSYINGGNQFQHYAIQWDSLRGVADLFMDGILYAKYEDSGWVPENTPSSFKIGMQASSSGKIILDEFRISRTNRYDASVTLLSRSFDCYIYEYTPDVSR